MTEYLIYITTVMIIIVILYMIWQKNNRPAVH